MKKRSKARDYGDNPRIRHSFGEADNVHMKQSWEVHYAKNRAKIKRQRARRRRSSGIL